MYRRINTEPRFIKAKFKSICSETGKNIAKGEECLYFPKEKKVYSLSSDTVYRFRNAKMDEEVLTPDYF